MRIRQHLFVVAAFLLAIMPSSMHALAKPAAATSALFQTSWQHGLSGWKVSGDKDVHVAHGMLSYPGGGLVQLSAPYRAGKRAHFAVQASIRDDGSNSIAAIYGFGLFVRQPGKSPFDGILGGDYSSDGPLDGPQLLWNSDSIGGVAYQPDSAWHIYRLQVNGRTYSLFIDGKQVVQDTTISAYHAGTQVGIWSQDTRIDVRSFKVMALSPVPANSPADTDTLKRLVPTGDPGGLIQTDGDFYGNQEFSRTAGIPLATVKSKGRLLSYTADLSSTTGVITHAITRFTGPAGAQWGYDLNIRQDLATYRSVEGFQQLSAPQIGDGSSVFSYPYMHRAQPATSVVVEFHRGNYSVFLQVSYVQGQQAQNLALELANKVDASLVPGY